MSSALETARNVLKISSPYIRGQSKSTLVGSRPVRQPDGAAPFSGKGPATLVKPGLLARVWLAQFAIRAEAAPCAFCDARRRDFLAISPYLLFSNRVLF